MAETKTSKLLTLDGLTTALTSVRNYLLTAAGKLKASIIPIGSGLKEVDGNIVFDADNVEIDASKVNIATASSTVKGLVQVGSGINVDDNGVISVTPSTSLLTPPPRRLTPSLRPRPKPPSMPS